MQAPINDLGSYSHFLESFLRQGYRFLFFPELTNGEGEAVLRHDVDFDTSFAVQMARIEKEMGIKATYFFLLRSNFYNIFSCRDYENVCRIREWGHDISIHFDPLIYDDFREGLLREVQVFRRYFDKEVSIISIHRPNAFFQTYDAPIMGLEHTYQSRYFRDIKYFSDSTGAWRFGHPVDSDEFRRRRPLHVLTHPVWWMVNGESNTEKLRTYFGQRIQSLKDEFFNNCVPFRNIHELL